MKHLVTVVANFFGMLVLVSLLALPFYFSSKVVQSGNVAGVKSTSPYILISQIDKFPGLQFSQQSNNYKISFDKISKSQAFIGVLLISNPTNKSQTYQLISQNTTAKMFFGDDLNNQIQMITLPSAATVPLSIYSVGLPDQETVEFKISTN
ncbi:hypothetical protein HY024_00085 [Candidatus Curtissbacteria bacterium]|nr:hypothetical protein [Candidatus Curtissbacteria bacterium]